MGEKVLSKASTSSSDTRTVAHDMEHKRVAYTVKNDRGYLMKRNIGLWQLIGFGFVSLGGTLLHFLYDLTGSSVAALFSGVNESTWEHMKLLFFPLLLFAVLQNFCMGSAYENFWCIKLKGTLLGLSLIPVIFYTLRGIFGTTPDWVNIGIFFLAAAGTFFYETRQFQKEDPPCKASGWAFAAMCLIAVAFWVFTFMPPEIPLFQDPLDGGYGLQKSIN